MIDVPQIDMLVELYISLYKQTPAARNFYAEYDKAHLKSWVYFKPDNIVYPTDFAEHMMTVQKICKDFFKGFSQSELSTEYMKRFLHENFEIKSANTSMTNIINDVDWIIREINMYRRNSFKEMI